MLSKLEISNLAIIERLSIDFSSGFNVITGETGAGKSIMIKALQLILGGKSSGDIVRNEASEATVSAVFLVRENHPSFEVLNEVGIELIGQNEILIRRSVNTKGRSRAWINDTLVTAATLKKVGLTLIDIFGQNDSSKLLDPSKHIHLLDQFVPAKYKSEYRTSFEKFEHAFSQLKQLLNSYVTISEQEDYLSFRFKELESFDPNEEDYLSLSEKAGVIREVSRKKETVERVVEVLNSPKGLLANLMNVESNLPGIIGLIKGLEGSLEKTEEARAAFEDMSYEIEKWLSRMSETCSEEDMVEARISMYQDLYRKTGTSNISELIEYKNRIEGELSEISVLEEKISNLVALLPKIVDEIKNAGKKLSLQRIKAADDVAKKIATELEALAMNGAKISIKFLPVNSKYLLEHFDVLSNDDKNIFATASERLSGLSSLGSERPVIHLSSNLGEEAKPLERIASGGEVSRIMLSLKRVLASGADACVLVFDEIDAGISGEVADKVGAKLKELSESFQILCISHLAQVASYADKHFKVAKHLEGSKTFATINPLLEKESTKELARLMSGEKLTRASVDHARILKEKAKNLSS